MSGLRHPLVLETKECWRTSFRLQIQFGLSQERFFGKGLDLIPRWYANCFYVFGNFWIRYNSIEKSILAAFSIVTILFSHFINLAILN